jgi:hypothetical protein
LLDEPNQQNSRELNIVIHITIEKEKHMYIQWSKVLCRKMFHWQMYKFSFGNFSKMTWELRNRWIITSRICIMERKKNTVKQMYTLSNEAKKPSLIWVNKVIESTVRKEKNVEVETRKYYYMELKMDKEIVNCFMY